MASTTHDISPPATDAHGRTHEPKPYANPYLAGIGLGLSFARAIARAHGGDITVTSEVGVGSTFTITNPGQFGGLFGLPIINQPQVAIMGLGGIKKRPVVIHDAIAIRSMMYVSMSYDHRVVDGAVADQFLARLKHTLENFDESLL